MQRRAFKRVPADFDFHCFDTKHYGKVTNISENGMFISSQKISFPLAPQFEISIPLNGKVLNVPVHVKRLTKSNGFYDGIGVELLNPSKRYQKFVKKIRALAAVQYQQKNARC